MTRPLSAGALRGLRLRAQRLAGTPARTVVVRTWALRGTLHVLAAADVRWMVRLLGPVFVKAGRRRRGQLGLDDATCERALAAIEKVLTGSRPLTRAELIERLADEGMRIDPGRRRRRTCSATRRTRA